MFFTVFFRLLFALAGKPPLPDGLRGWDWDL